MLDRYQYSLVDLLWAVMEVGGGLERTARLQLIYQVCDCDTLSSCCARSTAYAEGGQEGVRRGSGGGQKWGHVPSEGDGVD